VTVAFGPLCVAGYVFTKLHCRALDKGWRSMLTRYDLPFFRMSACAHGTKPFAHLSMARRIAVETEAIGLIKRHAACGFAITVDPIEFEAVAERYGFIGTPYELCVWMCLGGSHLGRRERADRR
jgi:hypothetical protein